MNNILVSFCIATFQRYEILNELIMELLFVDSDSFEIVVCDDCSQDGSIEKLRQIQDPRLHIFVNSGNVGSLPNIYKALERGRGQYLFYVNDRDNVDFFKVKKMIQILDELREKKVAFLKCIDEQNVNAKYRIYQSGEEAFLEFACKVDHPTGYIFSRKAWRSVKCRKKLFEKQCYGDYSITMICAILALQCSGAYLYGDICDLKRERINFEREKSGYYQKRKDKRVWYSPEVQWRELLIAWKFLKSIAVEEVLIDRLLARRYETYLKRVMLQYKEIISKPANTSHYNLWVSQNPVVLYGRAFRNGLYLWRNMQCFCRREKKEELLREIHRCTKLNYSKYIGMMYEDLWKEIEK